MIPLTILVAIAFLCLAAERFIPGFPPWLTGIVCGIIGILALFGGGLQ